MNWIKQQVKNIVQTYKTNCPFEVSKSKNIHVVFWNLHHEIWGFYKYERRNRFIFINNNLEIHQQRYVCAHELGHAILHTKVNTPFLRTNTLYSVDKIEREANEFAVNLLLFDKNLCDYQTNNDILREFGIPCEMEQFLKKFFYS
ncbi:ImmA/IrrE family metallo-endopeptidase [Neobacillus thermocopriae]|uniref:ImmA/IrrE family metallo-endopeptidase n=1 Tax=Neobacillus thermocopriae TaxID=1215031 RepID=UPI001969E6BF|nr:ImmA/IrrE family metallo-endopeptidase [Neobacillus thermocopriae]